MNLPIRKIIHIDMDAFYAAVEQHDNPELRGTPVVVGGGMHGVVAAASYEARKYGIHSAMPGRIALEKCPHLIVVKPRFDRYKEVSEKIRKIFFQYTDLVEPLSLDEAYLDVTENKKDLHFANEIAREIRKQIFIETGLTASAGISINKFLAKVASDYNKPNGQKTIHPQEVLEFMEALPIEKFYGIGKVTANKMHELHIFNGKDLKQKPLDELVKNFGKAGHYFYHVVRGIHQSEVKPHRIRKSVGVEETFWENLVDNEQVYKQLDIITDKLLERSSHKNIKGKSLTLKIKYQDFTLFTRSKTFDQYYQNKTEIVETAKELWKQRPYDRPVRLLGLALSNLNTSEQKNVSIQLKIPFPNF